MLEEIQKISVDFRLEKARDCLKDANLLLSAKSYASSANRSYYAIYNAIRAVLITVDFSSKTHSGNIGEFRRRYIKNRDFS